MSPEVEREIESTYRRTLIITTSVGVSILVILVLNVFLVGRGLGISIRDYRTLRIAITVTVLFLALGSILLRRYMFNSMKMEIVRATGGIKGMLQHLSKTSVLLSAITEAAAILGLVFGIITGDSAFATSLILVGLAVFTVGFPRRSSWLRAVAVAEATS